MKMGDSQGADQGAQGGYGDQAEQSYGGEVAQSYAAPAVAAVEAYRPEICVSLCPDEAPFFNAATGGCQPGICRQEVAYAAPVQSYGAPVQSYGGQQQSGYRKLQQSYGAPVEQSYGGMQSYGAPAPECNLEAPRGTIDTRNNRVGRSGLIALWIGFALLFLSSVYFINRYLWLYYLADIADGRQDWRIGSEGGQDVYAFLASPSLICGMVTFIASLAYLAMATHHGFYTRCFDGREFYYARYLDWVITTPMMLHALAYIGNMSDNIWHYLFFNDILMIISGLIGSTVGGGDKWVFFGFSILCYLPVIYYLCERKNRAIDNRIFDEFGNPDVDLGTAGASNRSAFLPHVWFLVGYNNIMRLTVAAWTLYPVVWILAEGTGTISANGEAVFYTVLDLISKAGFGIIIVTMRRNSFAQTVAAGWKMKFEVDGTDAAKGKNWSDAAASWIGGAVAMTLGGSSAL